MHRTIPTLFRSAVEDAPDAPWLFAEDLVLTFAEAQARVERAASALRALGVGPGERVLVTARNLPDHLLAWLALMEVGAVQLPVNPRSTGAELGGFVRQARPRLVLTDAGLVAMVAAALADHGGGGAPLVDVAELFAAEPDGRGPADREPDDVAVMIPTSGTTGRSKLVMQTHLA